MNSRYINVSGLDDATLLNYYKNLKKQVQSIVYYLNKCVNSLNGVDGVLMKNYNIDDNRVDKINVESLCETLKDRVSYLNYTLIPSIDSKIRNLK